MVKTVVNLQVTFYAETRDQEFAGLLRRSYHKMKREIPYVEKWMFAPLKISWDEISPT